MDLTSDYSLRTDDSIAVSKSFSFLEDLDLDLDVRRRLANHLSFILKGNSDVYTTPLVKRRSPESVLAGWDSVIQANLDKLNEPLLNLEISNRSKFGPRSIAKSWSDRLVSLKKYYDGREAATTSDLNIVLPRNNLRPIKLDTAIKLLKNNTNSGLPFYTDKGKVKERYKTKLDLLLERKDPCILFTRTQEGGKTRDVWGYPMADTLFEMMYYQPLLSYQRSLDWRSAIRSPEEIDLAVTRLIDFAKSNGHKIVSVDFSAFDSSVSNDLINKSFSYIKSLFQSKYHGEIDIIRHRFNTIPILTPDGVKTGYHGVPSGSTFTNEVDSLVQYIVASESGFISPGAFQIQGDDGIYSVKPDNVDPFLNKFGSRGLNINREKSDIADEYGIYLQRLYHTDYRLKNGTIGGIYPTYRAIERLVYQERWSDFEDFGLKGTDYYSIRAISILENCKHHPLFEQLVKYVYSLDKYSLGFDSEGVNKYYNLLVDGKGSGGVIYNQYGDDIKGISSFDTIKVLRSIA